MNDQIACAIADRVYSDLQQDRRCANIERIEDTELSKIYFRVDREGGPAIVLPILNTQDVNLLELEELQAKWLSEECKNITLAICDTSSNVLYYQLTSGFAPQQPQSN